MNIHRAWAMPNGCTFTIRPVAKLIDSVIADCGRNPVIVDPFARDSDIASISNDLDPDTGAMYHMDALDFLVEHVGDACADLVLFDPPYSPRQVSELYKKIDRTVTMTDTQSSFWSKLKAEIQRITKPGGKCITFGWNSGGIGESYGFTIDEILLVAHGGWHNDTICTVETRHNQSQGDMYEMA